MVTTKCYGVIADLAGAPGDHSASRNSSHVRLQCAVAPQGARCIEGTQSSAFLWQNNHVNAISWEQNRNLPHVTSQCAVVP